MKKNIYIVMYNFPPIGIGRGIAWCKFAEKISEKHNVKVITVEPSKNDPYYNEDKKNLYKDKNFEVIRIKDAKIFYKLYSNNVSSSIKKIDTKKTLKGKILTYLIKIYKTMSRIFFYPDRMVFWSKKAYKLLKGENKKEKIDLIVSVGFPFSTHIYMSKLKKQINCKLICDYGDPWCFNPSTETVPSWRKKIDFKSEKKVVENSDYITVTTEMTKKKFIELFNIKNIGVIRQGVNNDEYKIVKKSTPRKSLRLVYTGIFYEKIRNPELFFKALKSIDLNLSYEVEILIAGHMELFIKNLIVKYELENLKNITIKFKGNLKFKECIELQNSSDALLFFSNSGNMQVPGKIYEYFATQKPIISISYELGETEELIQKAKRGYILINTDNDLSSKLLDKLNSIKNEEYLKEMNLDEIIDYDWRLLSENMSEIINNVIREESNNEKSSNM